MKFNRMYLPRLFCLLLITPGLGQSALASDQTPPQQWDRSSAMLAVRAVNIDLAVSQIGGLAALSDAETTLNNLIVVANRNDWPLPAREAVIYHFTRSLAPLPRGAVATKVMQYLQTYQALALVPHEDHGRALVPLFNIRAAAAGVEHGWRRSESSLEAQSLLATDPAALVSRYRNSADHNVRAGYLDALRTADLSTLTAVQNIALAQLADDPNLTALVGLTASISGDVGAVFELLQHGRGTGLAAALTAIGERLQAVELGVLLATAIAQAPAANSALAIAQWWPALQHDAATRQLLLNTLADVELGSAAALALAQNPDTQTINSLQDIAAGNTLAARRAQLALALNQSSLAVELRP